MCAIGDVAHSKLNETPMVTLPLNCQPTRLRHGLLPLHVGTVLEHLWLFAVCLMLASACASDMAVDGEAEEGTDAGNVDTDERTPAEAADGDDATSTEGDEDASALLCPGDLQDCDGDPSTGCETDTSSDRSHCGGCNAPCHGTCADGICSDPIQLALSIRHSCAVLGNGQVSCWGSNYNGELGHGTRGYIDPSVGLVLDPTEGLTSPTPPAGTFPVAALQPQRVLLSNHTPLEGVRSVVVGEHHSCALTVDGHVYCWGANHKGQLGANFLIGALARAVPVVGTPSGLGSGARLSNVASISAGWNHTCAVLTNERVVCWGDDAAGQLGRGGEDTINASFSSRPVPMVSLSGDPFLGGVKQVATGDFHTCVTFEEGMACVGSQGSGRLGNMMTSGIVRTPVAVRHVNLSGGLWRESPRAMQAQRWGNCVLLESGNVACWGNPVHGRLGNGSLAVRSRPVLVRNAGNTGPLTGVTQLSAFDAHACALVESGEAFCWGWNRDFQLGIDTIVADTTSPTESSALPRAVLDPADGLPLRGIAEIAVGTFHTCTRMQDGRVLCWGRSTSGLTGQSTSSRPRLAREVTFSEEG